MIVADRAIEATRVSASTTYTRAYTLQENAVLSIISALMTFAAGTLVTFLQGHFLPVAVFGRIMYAATFSGLVALIPNYGFELLVIREIAQNHYSPAQTLTNVLFAKTLLLIPAAMLTQVFIWLNHTPAEEATLIWVYLVAFFALALSRTFCAVNKGHDNFRVECAVYTLQAGIILLGALFVIWILQLTEGMPQAWLALVGRSSGLLLGAVLTTRLWGAKLRLAPDWSITKGLLREGFPFALQAALATAYMQIDTLFIRNLLGLEETAYYQAALRIIVGINVLATFLTNAYYPRVARSFKNGSATAQLDNSCRMMHALTLVGMLVSVGLFVGAEPLMHLVYGDHMSPSVTVLRIAAFIPLIRFISGGYGVVLISIHRQEVQVIGAAVATVLIAALDWFLVPTAGYIAAAWVNLLANSVVLGIFLFVILKELRSTLITPSFPALYHDTLTLWNAGAQVVRRVFPMSRRGN
jgi:PST family polysaccharide transporter